LSNLTFLPIQDSPKREKHFYELSHRDSSTPIPKHVPIVKENEQQQKVIKGSEKDSFKRYLKQHQLVNLPTIKPIIYTKYKTESNAFNTANRELDSLEKYTLSQTSHKVNSINSIINKKYD
jgi:hypothetical protein